MDNVTKQKFSSPLDFIYQARDPNKRQIKPVDRHLELLQLAYSIEASDSSDDEEYVPKDMDVDEDDAEDNESDADSDTGDDDDDDDDEDDDDEDGVQGDGEVDEDESKLSSAVNEVVKSPQKSSSFASLKICSVCLGDESRGDDEIVECDACGIPVHETCYGIVSEDDTQSVHSNVSSESTEPWFCEPCRRGVKSPNCDLCPNSGGIFKETNNGRWVHTACALYTHGVTFNDVDRLSGVTLFELNYSMWGAKACTICEDQRLARSGICIGCDAGLCKTYFHVTCAQKEGLLSESHAADDIDPFIAHCKMHADKNTMKMKRRTCLALQAKLRKIPQDSLYVYNERTKKKLEEQKSKWRQELNDSANNNELPPIPYKVSRMLMTSPSVIKRLSRKSELLGLEPNSAFMSIADEMEAARRKWHIPPGFNLEFVAYVLDRTSRMATMKRRNTDLINQNAQLKNLETKLRSSYDELRNNIESLRKQRDNLIHQAKSKQRMLVDKSVQFPVQITDLIQRASRNVIRERESKLQNHKVGSHEKSVKRFAGSKIKNNAIAAKNEVVIPEITNHTCGLCKQSKDQHLMALCDTCHLYLHIYCLDPPLNRVPKKTKFSGWQCSDCVDDSS